MAIEQENRKKERKTNFTLIAKKEKKQRVFAIPFEYNEEEKNKLLDLFKDKKNSELFFQAEGYIKKLLNNNMTAELFLSKISDIIIEKHSLKKNTTLTQPKIQKPS